MYQFPETSSPNDDEYTELISLNTVHHVSVHSRVIMEGRMRNEFSFELRVAQPHHRSEPSPSSLPGASLSKLIIGRPIAAYAELGPSSSMVGCGVRHLGNRGDARLGTYIGGDPRGPGFKSRRAHQPSQSLYCSSRLLCPLYPTLCRMLALLLLAYGCMHVTASRRTTSLLYTPRPMCTSV